MLLLCGPRPAAPQQTVTVTGHVVRVEPVGHPRPPHASPVVVWLRPLDRLPPSPQNSARPGPPHRFRVLQKHKRFDPHLLVVPAGSVVEFPNLDPFFHNVFSLFEGKSFDLGLYEAGSTRLVRFDRPGISYIFCNIHPEMSAVVMALDTPYFAIANGNGDLSIPIVPVGRYRLELWDERALPETLKSLSREVTVSQDYRSLGVLRLNEAGNLLRAHKNKYGRDYDPPTPTNPLYEQH